MSENLATFSAEHTLSTKADTVSDHNELKAWGPDITITLGGDGTAVAKGRYQVESRSMLQLDSHPEIFGDLNFALNDFAVHKRDTSSMISIHTYLDGDYLNS